MGDTFGYGAAVGWGVESTWGTLAARTKFAEVISENIKKDVERQESPSTRGLSELRRQDFLTSITGSFETEMLYAGYEILLEHLFGGVAGVVIGGSVDGFTNTYTLTDALPPGLTIEANRGDSAAGQTALYEGCKISSATFTFNPNEPVKVTWNIVGQEETFINATAVVYPDYSGILLTKGHHVTCEINTVAQVIDSAEVTFDNGLDVAKRVMGVQTIAEPIRSTRRIVTGTITVDWTDKVLYEKFINGTAIAIELICTGTDMGNDTSDPLRFQITIPSARFSGETPSVSSTGIIKQALPFYGLSTGTGVLDSVYAETDSLVDAVP